MIEGVRYEGNLRARRRLDGGRKNYAPIIRRKPSEWATQVRRIASGTATITSHEIAYDHALMPHLVEIMDAEDNPKIRTIVMWGPKRGGKTNGVCMNSIGRTVTDDPKNIYSVHPIDDDVQRFSEGDLEPTIQACLEDYFVDKKSRDSGRTIFFKKYKGGWIRIVNSGSLTKFRGTNVGRLYLHELDALDETAIEMAQGRTTGIPDAKIYKESTGTIASEFSPDGKEIYHSHIKKALDEGSQKKWFCACRSCGYLQLIEYEQIKYPPGKMALAKYHCRACDHAHAPREFRKMVASGQWFSTAGLTAAQVKDIRKNARYARAYDESVDSYWWNGFISLLPAHSAYQSKLHEFVAEGEAAKRSPIALKVWTQEVKAELWKESHGKVEPPPFQPILDGREDYATDALVIVPARGVVITAMTDLHGNRLEVEWRAWARNEESWGLGHFVLHGDTNRTEVWQEWTTHLQRKWQHESGAAIGLNMAFVDGGWRADPISATLRRLQEVNVPGVSGKIRASKGVAEWQDVIHKRWATISNKLKGIHIGTWRAKSLIYERLGWHSAEVKPSDGFIHFGKSYSEEFIRQVVSEKSEFRIVKGVNVEIFKNPEGNRNEALDLIVGNLAAFRYNKWDFETLEREIARLAAVAKGDVKPEPVKKKAMMVSLGGMQ